MRQMDKVDIPYYGFEQGPIRPPSEAHSLLIRVTRNCPWNHCTFCPVYKDAKFSVRPVAHVKSDIDAVHQSVTALRRMADNSGRILRHELGAASEKMAANDNVALQAALQWFSGGMRSIFIQDANSLILKPSHLIEILKYLTAKFPWVERITSYARSHTIARIKDEDLATMRMAGLNRIHIGLESGSDAVLKQVRKGADKATHIKAGIKVKKAGIQLSEYVMPGLGGRAFSDEHALETAEALNKINPDFIRLRTLAVPRNLPLYQELKAGRFEKCNDVEMVSEIRLFIENLDGITSTVKSDHVLNLFQDVEGALPGEKQHMLNILQSFLAMTPEQQMYYQVGRRFGLFSRLDHMARPRRLAKVKGICRQHGITADNVDEVIRDVMRRFI